MARTTLTEAHPSPPESRGPGALLWLRENLFPSPLSALLSLAIIALLAWAGFHLLRWGVVQAHWGGDSDLCRAAEQGACWSFVSAKYRYILFGLYPSDEQWRPMTAVVVFVGMLGISAWPRCWRRWLPLAWVLTLGLCYLLMGGGMFGLSIVPNSQWGGLPLTLMLSVIGIVVAFPLAVLLALGRRSELPAIRALCVGYIELIRGVPLISVLFMASVMFPLLMPEGMTFDKLLRAQIAIVLFVAAYMAEVIRGGLQALPRGQYEAAASLGLGYWRTTGLIILPQALKITIPPMVGTFIGTFKDTSLVIIIGLFDLMTTTKTALSDPNWLGFSAEAYLFTAGIYFVFSYCMSRYSRYLEDRLHLRGGPGTR